MQLRRPHLNSSSGGSDVERVGVWAVSHVQWQALVGEGPMQREGGCYPRQTNTIPSSLAVWREDVLRCQEQVSELEQGRGMMASSQVDRVPCWTLKPGLCTENGGRPALGPLTPPFPPGRIQRSQQQLQVLHGYCAF